MSNTLEKAEKQNAFVGADQGTSLNFVDLAHDSRNKYDRGGSTPANPAHHSLVDFMVTDGAVGAGVGAGVGALPTLGEPLAALDIVTVPVGTAAGAIIGGAVGLFQYLRQEADELL